MQPYDAVALSESKDMVWLVTDIQCDRYGGIKGGIAMKLWKLYRCERDKRAGQTKGLNCCCITLFMKHWLSATGSRE